MDCPTCGTPNEPGRKFCGECGTALVQPCPNCGASNAPGTKFCGECGTGLRSESPTADAEPRPQPTAERRLVSVLFADLVGFTTLSEARDPEVVRDLLARYFDGATRIIGSYGGTVEKFIGDAVMAVWGAPTAHEDDAERAVRSALDLVEAVRALGEETGAELTIRAGVLTGEAAVTLGATNQGMVAGDLVNTAARLQSIAPPGTVLVGESTMHSASEAIAFEPAGAQLLKGKAAPVPAFRALRVVARRGGAGRTEQLEAPFVGRQAELRLLKDFHAATAAERKPRQVSIIGQGGIGKSRLVWEFQKYMDGVTEVVYWHQGRSPAYGEGISFWALAEMVRGRAGITEADDPAAARAKVAASLNEWVPDEGDRRWIEPALLQLLGLNGGDGEARTERESLFAAWRVFFERIADRGVVVLVFEDLQWADEGLLDFIDHVLDWSRDRPIYVISLARPELLDRRSDWGAGRRSFTSLVLDPLGPADMRELLAGLVPGLPEPVVDRILERADGIPLYAVETVRMLLSDGHLVADGGVYQPVGDLSELSVPPSLHALIAARLDALDAADRSLLQAGAVLGKTFTVAAIAEVGGGTPDDVLRRLRDLVRREMLTLDADPRSPEQGQFGFVQGLIRDVAYGTLARADRRRLHLAAARHFESLDDEGIAGALAEHYVAAYRAQPDGPEGEAVAAQARVALRGAAERARSLGSFTQALRFFERALEVTTDPAEQRQLHSAATRAALFAGRAEEELEHSERALELARAGDDRLATLQATADRGTALRTDGQVVEAIELLETTRSEAADLAETAEYVHLSGELARSYMLNGRHEDGIRLVDETLPMAERLELTRDTLHMIITRGPALASLGRVREATISLLGAVTAASSYGMPDVETRARVNLSYAAAAEDPVLAYRVAREGAELAYRLGMRGPSFYLLGNASDLAMRVGDWEWTLAHLPDAVADGDPVAAVRQLQFECLMGIDVEERLAHETIKYVGTTELQATAVMDEVAALAAMARGEFTRALELAQKSFRLVFAPDGNAVQIANRAAAWTGDREALRDLIGVYEGVPGRVMSAGKLEAVAGIAALEGRRAEAHAAYVDALRRWHEVGAEFEAGWCALNLVTMLGDESAEASTAADEAAALFERLGAKAMTDLLTAARRAGPRVQPPAPSPAREASAVHVTPE